MTDTIIARGAANFVAGKWTPSRGGGTYERHNPWRPSEVVGEFPSSSAEDVDAAVAAASDAFPGGRRCPPPRAGRSSRAPRPRSNRGSRTSRRT